MLRPIIAIALVLTTVFSGEMLRADEPILRVALRPYIEASNEIVRIGDVADVTAADPRIEKAVANLDLADPPTMGVVRTVSREQLQVRLALAGINSDDALVSGANNVRIAYRPAGVRDQTILAAMESPVAMVLGVQQNRLDIKLAQPLPSTLTSIEPTRLTRFEARVPPASRPGVLRVPVAVFEGERLLKMATVSVDVKVLQLVGRTTRNVKAGEAFDSTNTVWESLAVAGGWADDLANESQVAGQTAGRNLTTGSMIHISDLRQAPNLVEEKSPILVKSRDLVRVTARKGDLRVVLSAAQALQQGRLDDVIRIRNTATGKVISGRVVGPGQVETEL
ncbi:MAG: flagellar basal body P-ring formation chaperone FlgA [bacterium]|nr:flagellar basal body P-ring formation chaperone FlgA [bacterium]